MDGTGEDDRFLCLVRVEGDEPESEPEFEPELKPRFGEETTVRQQRKHRGARSQSSDFKNGLYPVPVPVPPSC